MSESKEQELNERLRTALFAGRKIEAIKLYRENTKSGLKEAKDHIDALEAQLRQQKPEQFSAPKGAGCLGLFLGLLVLFGAILK
jgi:ribosomal protein L7/L12